MTVGSSPLARGLPPSRRHSQCYSRIIPARAGFTAHRPARVRPGRDHPRSRGVYRHRGSPPAPPAGSSPLARGLPTATATAPNTYRIIPARAGFTLRGVTGGNITLDHPRSRGVYFAGSNRRKYHSGSSPLARGLPYLAPHCERAAVDHPRSRGVYSTPEALTG